MDIGDPAMVLVQSLRSEGIDTEVTRTSWSLRETNRSLVTEIDIDNKDGLLRPGMYATVSILLAEWADVLTLPLAATVQGTTETLCYTDESGLVQPKPIVLGLRSGNEVEVVSGPNGDESVVLAPAPSLQAGQRVEVIEKS